MADKDKKVKGFKEFDPKKFIDTEPTLDEAVKGTAVISFGRMNPVTVGHEKLVNKVLAVAAKAKATPLIYLSHSEDARKNPLSYNDKIKFAKQAFGKVIQKSKSRSIIEVAKELSGKFSNLIVVVGSDRVAEFNALLNKYNGKEYNFQVIDVQSAGERDPDAEGVEGMSASKMRSLAADNDLNQFKKGLPKRLQRNADDVLSAVRQGMNMAEEKEEIVEALDRAQRRRRAMTLRKHRAKIKRGREKAMRRKADTSRLKKRAQKKAIMFFKDKFAKHKRYADLDVGQKMRIDDRIKKIDKKRIERIARKMLIQVRKDERARFAAKATDNPLTPQRESVNEAAPLLVPIIGAAGRAIIGGLARKGGQEAIKQATKQAAKKAAKDKAKDVAKRTAGQAKNLAKRAGPAVAAVGGLKGLGKLGAAGVAANIAGRAAGRIAGNVMNNRDEKKNQRESFSAFLEAKSIKVGETAIGAESTAYAVVKEREIIAIGDKSDMLAFAEDEGGRVWMVSSENQVGDLLEGVKQDPDVKDMKGSQPAVYFKGVKKSKKDDRERHFKKHGKKADNDPSAYKPAPGDKEAKTKESKHTKKARAMGYTEELVWEDLIDGLDEGMCSSNSPKKRPHMLMDKNMRPKLDKRFKMFRPKMDESLDEQEVYKLMEETEAFIEEWVCGQCNSDPCVCEGDGLQEDAAGASLKKKAEKSGMPVGILRQVFNRGKAAWKTGHRPGTTPDQWGHARVNSFITKSSGTWGKADKDLAAKVRKEEVEQLDELSPKTLDSFVDKAYPSRDALRKKAQAHATLGNDDEAQKLKAKAKKRGASVSKAIARSAAQTTGYTGEKGSNVDKAAKKMPQSYWWNNRKESVELDEGNLDSYYAYHDAKDKYHKDNPGADFEKAPEHHKQMYINREMQKRGYTKDGSRWVKESVDNHPKYRAAQKAHKAGTWDGNVDKEGRPIVHIEGKPVLVKEVAPLLLVKPAMRAATKIAAKASKAIDKEKMKKEGEGLDYEKERRKAIKKNVNTKPDLDEMAEAFLNEKLKKSDSMGTWIKDFYDSDAPQFKGKSKAKRRQMAVAAKLSAEEQNEELGHFVKKTRQAVHNAVKAAVVGKSGDTANRHVSKPAQSAHRISGAARAQGSDSHTSHVQSKRINQQMSAPQRRYESVNEEGGAGGEGTDKLTKKYKKDTPGQNNG